MDSRLLEAQALLRQGQVQLAEILCRQAVADDAGLAPGWAMLGSIAAYRKDFAQAASLLERALAIDASSADMHFRLGVLRNQLGQWDAALAAFDASLARMPGAPQALNLRGEALGHLGRWEEALASFEQAVAQSPDSAVAQMNLGVSLYELYRFDAALHALERALALAPDNLEVLFNRANVLMELDRFDEALAGFERVRAHRPGDVQLLMNIANTLRDQHRFDEALRTYAQALALAPDDAGLNWNRALCLLTAGDYERGWAAYEWRFRAGKLGNVQRGIDAPKWTGSEDLQGRTLLVHAEQGLGDTIEMARYLPLLAERGAKVVMEVQRPLLPLFQFARGATRVVGPGEVVQADFHCPMLSLPHVFGTGRGNIPPAVGWLAPPADLVARWKDVISSRAGTGPNVGLVWSGNPGYAGDHRRSLSLERFRTALPAGPRYWCLQKDIAVADEPSLSVDPVIQRFAENDFPNTAAQIAALDLVITVDTSLMHLAATLGARTWLLLPFTADFRWGTDTQESPWYPGMRLFRQQRAGDWAPVLAEVRAALVQA
ncbi:tetratricopeptide repeat protein [Caenimonas aquaedulcis]|uniref:Tetratricopeptide repeat protein n=1 Tax=Caenimonas aquaedulcis TaxID=2793270 RepID=A0A931MHM7_9BURK|nr:tetratricopeptide repeat protein [Caenimonas aquaedulcis]MBG9389102.1 tetratricopeptide repeat protein [Caenimonas aquaedulcis]